MQRPLPIRFLRTGAWSASQLTVARVPNSRRLLPEVEAAIETAWTAALARPGVHLFDGPMCRLESWTATDDQLSLDISKSSYKQFLGTNMAHPEFSEKFGSEVMANPIGVSPMLLTADQQLLLGVRSPNLAYYPGRVHPFAGCMEPGDTSPFASILRELNEELSLSNGEVIDLRCTGIAEDQSLKQPELIFAAGIRRTLRDIEASLDPVEHRGLWAIPATAPAVETAVNQDKALTPVAVASLLLWGRNQFGPEWFNQVTRIRS